MNARMLVSAIALVSVFAAGAAHARISNRDGYTEDTKASRTVEPYHDGARIEPRDRYTDGARTLAGMDHTGVSAPPAHAIGTDSASA